MTSSSLDCRMATVKTPIITITTDFGTADGYVGTMEGVILGIVPTARLVGISHEIAPQNIREAAYILYAVYPFFPSHTVHLAVVDPGVGSARRPIALRTPAGTFVGPDNGVFSYVMACEQVEAVVELADPRYRLPQVGYTFHGRDIFSPAAAHLAAGVPISALGPLVADPVILPPPRQEITSTGIIGEVMHVDHFGNCITTIGKLLWKGDELSLEPAFLRMREDGEERVRFQALGARIAVGSREIADVHHTFAEADPGEAVAVVGSDGHLTISVRQGDAARELGLRPGDEVTLMLG